MFGKLLSRRKLSSSHKKFAAQKHTEDTFELGTHKYQGNKYEIIDHPRRPESNPIFFLS